MLRNAKEMGGDEVVTKSGLMVGLGETFEEMVDTLGTLREHHVEVLTIGQYLRPTEQHLPIVRYWHPDEFKAARAGGLRARVPARRGRPAGAEQLPRRRARPPGPPGERAAGAAARRARTAGRLARRGIAPLRPLRAPGGAGPTRKLRQPVIPLKDNIPTDRFPFVTVALIVINFVVYILAIRHGGSFISGPERPGGAQVRADPVRDHALRQPLRLRRGRA